VHVSNEVDQWFSEFLGLDGCKLYCLPTDGVPRYSENKQQSNQKFGVNYRIRSTIMFSYLFSFVLFCCLCLCMTTNLSNLFNAKKVEFCLCRDRSFFQPLFYIKPQGPSQSPLFITLHTRDHTYVKLLFSVFLRLKPIFYLANFSLRNLLFLYFGLYYQDF